MGYARWPTSFYSKVESRLKESKGKLFSLGNQRTCSHLNGENIVLNHQGYERGEFVTKWERDEHRQEMEIMYDSRSKEYMIKICFIKLRIQGFSYQRLVIVIQFLFHYNDCTLFLSNSNSNPRLRS